MIKAVFKKEGIISDNFYHLLSISPNNDDRLSWKYLSWFRGNKFFFTYTDFEFVNINFSIQDLGTHFDIVVYNTTECVDIMSKEDVKIYFDRVVLKEFNDEVVKWQVSFKKTKSFLKKPESISYQDVFDLPYIYSHKKRIMTGNSSIVSNYLNVEIKYCIWKTENGWSDYKAIILDELDPDIRTMKEAFVFDFYKRTYK